MPGHIGFPAYCKAIAALPGTSAEIADRCGFRPKSVTGLMRRFWQLGLVTPAGIGYRKAVIWKYGIHPAVESIRMGGPIRPYANHILFAAMIRALGDARTARQLGEDVGVSLLSAQTAIRHLRAAGLVHLSEWGLCAFGRPVAMYELGKGRDVPKPAPQCNKVKWARYTQRKKFKAIETLDARELACT
jgi:Mn-dependent DtxR family transcriptional regulator